MDELDNNSTEVNKKNDKLISEQDAIDALIEWYGCEPNGMDYFKEILAKKSPAQSDAIPVAWIQEYADDWPDIGYAYENPIQGMLDDWRGEQDE